LNKDSKIFLLCFDLVLFFLLVIISVYLQTIIYIGGQAKGQFQVLYNRESIQSFKQFNSMTSHQIQNLDLIERIKKYSVDSLGYLPTDNFSEIVNQRKVPSLWVITASEPFDLKPYFWYFPIVGKVSYKGFFDKEKAQKEALKLQQLGYDTELSGVSAWSTLGWFSDPILNSTLDYDNFVIYCFMNSFTQLTMRQTL
jgi:predicted aminopeptidase